MLSGMTSSNCAAPEGASFGIMYAWRQTPCPSRPALAPWMTWRRSSCCRKSSLSAAASIPQPLLKDGAPCQTQAGDTNASSPQRAKSKRPCSLPFLPAPSPWWASVPELAYTAGPYPVCSSCAASSHLVTAPKPSTGAVSTWVRNYLCTRNDGASWEFRPGFYHEPHLMHAILSPLETRLSNDSSSVQSSTSPSPGTLSACPPRADDPGLHSLHQSWPDRISEGTCWPGGWGGGVGGHG